MQTLTHAARFAAALLLLSSPGYATQDDVAQPGFELEHLAYPGGSVTVTLSGGGIVAFDGTNIDRFDSTGSLVANLGSLASFAFPSFILVDETEGTIVFGESSNGKLYSLLLSPSTPLEITTLILNYDAVFEDPDHIIVSAATLGFSNGTQIFRVDINDGTSTQLAQVAGPSGPVALTPSGDLFYATASSTFPAPAGSTSVILWAAADLTGTTVAQESDAVVVAAGFDGAGDLAYDAATGDLFVAENSFGSGINRLRQVDGVTNPIIVEGVNGRSMGNLEFRSGNGVARFAPYQPLTGGELLYNTTDFSTVLERNSVRPARPSASIAGPGASGPGPFTVSYDGAPSNGFAILYYNTQASLPATELVFQFARPLFLGLSPAGLARIPGLFMTDSSGMGEATYVNPGGMEGIYAFQFLIFDSSATLAGSSSVQLW